MSGQTVPVFGGMQVDISKFDFNNHSSRVANVRTTNILLIILVVSTVSLRLLARAMFVRNVFADDILIMFAAMFTIALAITCILATDYGLGTHIWLLPLPNIVETIKSFILHLYIAQVLYAFSIALTKIAIISSYLRFIQNQTFRIAMYVTSFFIVGIWVTGVFVAIFQCTPVQGAWDFTIRTKKCINYTNYLYASSAVNVVTDILLCVLPWPYLWRLSMPVRQRIILCVLFAGGITACTVCIVRIFYLHYLYDIDTTFATVPALNLSVCESSLGIICVSIPALRPMVQRVFPNGLRSNLSSSKRPSRSVPLSDMTPKPGRSMIDTEHKGDVIVSQESISQIYVPHDQV